MKELMNQYKEILSIKRCDMDNFFVEFGHRCNENNFTVEFIFINNSNFTKDFKNKDEIIDFIERKYYVLKCKYLEVIIKELNKKIDNQRRELFNLNKAYNKVNKGK